MSIQDITQEALSQLFPVDHPAEPVPPAEQSSDEQSGSRPDGIIELDYATRGVHLDVKCAGDRLIEAVTILFNLGYFIEAITGVDWPNDGQLEAVYDFSRYDFDLCRVAIRVRTPRDNPHIPTITGVYSGANWHERETHDFFGIVFDGHPHLIPLLLPEDADFHPLLKDFHP